MSRFAWYSCVDLRDPCTGLDRIVELAPRYIMDQGDTPYADELSDAAFGYPSIAAASTSTTQANVRDKYLQCWAHPAFARLKAWRQANGVILDKMGDDHEYIQDWDHTVATTADYAPSFTTQAQVNAFWKLCVDAMEEVRAAGYFDNPAPNAAGNTTRPSACTSGGENPSTNNYPIRYFYRDFGLNMLPGGSDVRVITLDNMSYRSPWSDTDNASKTWLGAQQKEWLLDSLSDAAGYSRVLINSTKKWFKSTQFDNGDTIGEYTTERADILAAIDSTNCPATILSGDKHRPHAMIASKARGHAADIVDICACSLSEPSNVMGGTISGADAAWIGEAFVFGFGEFDASGSLTVGIRSAVTGSWLWSCVLPAGQRVPTFTAPQITRLA